MASHRQLTVGIHTLGCKVSQYESEAIGEGFERAGFVLSSPREVCDVYVINTCTVTAESDRKSRQAVRRAVAKNPRAIVAVCGCYSQASPSEVAKIPGVDIVIGTEGKMQVISAVMECLRERAGQPGETLDTPPRVSVTDLSSASFEKMCVTRAPRTRAYVKIEDGCQSKCTYCAIAGARGRVRSKPREDVIAEVEALYRSGTREIVLTGIETGSYGTDFPEKYDLADLICELDSRHSCDRIRLGSLAPELIGEDFARRVSGAAILAPHFHMSVQSGSDNVLRAMKRRYTAEGALRNIESLRRMNPTSQFTTDLMVGFPGESEEDFLRTVDFVRRVGFIDAHVFAYSQRRGTPAALYDGQIPEEEKRRRSAELIRVKNEVRDSVLEKIVNLGRPLGCILESYDGEFYTAHSDEFAEVKLRAGQGLVGEYVKVIPVSHKDGIIFATLINKT